MHAFVVPILVRHAGDNIKIPPTRFLQRPYCPLPSLCLLFHVTSFLAVPFSLSLFLPNPNLTVLMDPSISSSSSAAAAADQVVRRAAVIARHLREPAGGPPSASPVLAPAACLQYSPPEVSEKAAFDSREMRRLMDGHDLDGRDWLFRVMEESPLFCPRRRGGEKVFVAPDYNQTKEQQRVMTMRRIEYLLGRGVFEGWLTGQGPEAEIRKLAFFECLGIYDHSLAIKLGVHFFLW